MAQRVAVIGTGYVGLIQAVGLADFGNYVVGMDLREEVVRRLSEGEPPIFEHGLTEYLQRNLKTGRLSFTTNPEESLANADVVFIAVGTPETEDGSADLSQIDAVVADLAAHTDGRTIVVVKSTVPVGTNRRIAKRLKTADSDGLREFIVVSNPEFLREGRAVQDFFHPDRVIIGFEDPESEQAGYARRILEDLYRPLNLLSTPFVWTGLETAEMIKYASNAFLATKVTFVNQMANLAEAVGADIHAVARAMGMDGRISAKFLHPGPGYGGSCFPKDTKAIAATGKQHNITMSVINAVIEGNEAQKTRTAEKAIRLLTGDAKGMATGKTVAILGVTFKAETDDIRDSPAITIVRALLGAGARVNVHDPKGIASFRNVFADSIRYHDSEFECLRDADIAIVLTEWNEYRNLDLTRAADVMRGRLLMDTRNVMDPDDVRAAGFEYYGTGR
jgi:UDPglucose 6-dehydrogenase